MPKTVKKKEVKSSQSAPVKKTKKVRHHRIKEILLGFAILVVLIMITPAVLSLFFKDIPPVSAPDLALNKVTVPVADNAYFDMLKVQNAAVEVPQLIGDHGFLNSVLAGTAWDQPVVDDAIAKNAEALGYFADAAKKSSFQYPGYADPLNSYDITKFQSFGGVWATTRTAVLNAANLQKQGKEGDAFQQALHLIHVGASIQHSQGPMVTYLVGSNMKILGMQTIQRLLMDTKLSKIDLAPYITEVQNAVTRTDDIANGFKMEYTIQTAYLDDSSFQISGDAAQKAFLEIQQWVPWRAWVPKSYYFQPHKIIAEVTAEYRKVVSLNSTPCTETPQQPSYASTTPNIWMYYVRSYFLPNAIGQFMNEMAFHYGTELRTRLCNENFLNGATQTLIALKEFSQDNGALPISLTQLVPIYLPSVPLDPYDGKAIKYSAEKKIVYSVGSDHVDNGGSTGDDWQKMDDLTFTIK